MVKRSTLEKFIKKGGYEVVRFNGKIWRGIVDAHEKTGLPEMTISRLLKEHPTQPNIPIGRRIWVTPEQDAQLTRAISELEMIRKGLEMVERYFEQSLIVDLMEFRTRQELQNVTAEGFLNSLREQVEKGVKKKSSMEEILSNNLITLNSNLATLRKIAYNLSSN